MMTVGFSVIPVGTLDPAAIFASLADAVRWGELRFGVAGFYTRRTFTRPALASAGEVTRG
jgi:hypothetical protein